MKWTALFALCIMVMLSTSMVHAASILAGSRERSSIASNGAACLTDAKEAAKDLWPMAASFAPQVSKLKGKHPCGQWIMCERAYPSKGWRCKWR